MISVKVKELAVRVMDDIAQQLSEIDKIAQKNTEKVHSAFSSNRVSDTCFTATTGYGYNDRGREVMNRVFADIMTTQSSIVSTGFVSGTHAIAAALFATLSPGQTLLSASGLPYDTLHGVIGLHGDNPGTLSKYGIAYSQVDLNCDSTPDIKAICDYVSANKVGAVFVQRSRGYSTRRALTVEEIGSICDAVHTVDKNVAVVVDNCYGEFTQVIEPGDTGADLVAGSLIKNPGGGLIAKGGYVAGKGELVEAAAARMTAPGIGAQCGASPDGHRLMYQGLFMAPHTVAQAMKTAVFSARLFELLGYSVDPVFNSTRSDIIQMINLGSPDLLERFCKGIQAAAPVDSFITPVSSQMPGYNHPVIMAAGTFVQGASIEMSADAPVCEPYDVFLQGALTFESGKHSVMLAASYLDNY